MTSGKAARSSLALAHINTPPYVTARSLPLFLLSCPATKVGPYDLRKRPHCLIPPDTDAILKEIALSGAVECVQITFLEAYHLKPCFFQHRLGRTAGGYSGTDRKGAFLTHSCACDLI